MCMKVNMPLIKRKIFTESYACKESLLEVILYLKIKHNAKYKDILNYFNVNSLVPTWFKFFKPKFFAFLFRIEVSSKGLVKIRILNIPFIIFKRKNNNQ